MFNLLSKKNVTKASVSGGDAMVRIGHFLARVKICKRSTI